MKTFRWTALLCLFLTACRVGPDYRRPTVVTPAEWRTSVPDTATLSDLAWWDHYRDPVLNRLIASALTNNLDLRIAAARLEEARGAFIAQRSFLLPNLSGAGTWSRVGFGDIPPAPGATAGQFDISGLLSYEVDLWGRLRRLTESARAELLASDAARRTVQIDLVASVASTYFNLRALDRQREIAVETHAARTNLLALTELKFNPADGLGYGIVSELDVRQAETQVHTARATIASLDRAIAVTENALRFLLGQNPGSIPRGHTLNDQHQPEDIPSGLPSELLLRRPDLVAAEQQLIAANARIGAARATLFPSISLTGALGVQSSDLEDLFTLGTSRAWRFTPQLTGPIFNAGRLRAGVRIAEAREQAVLASYEKAIQNAFREVDDALVAVVRLREQLLAEEASVRAETRRLDLSRMRYLDGIASYTDLLDAQRFLFSAQLGAVQTRNALLIAHAQLFRALGGGWNPLSSPQPPSPVP